MITKIILIVSGIVSVFCLVIIVIGEYNARKKRITKADGRGQSPLL